MTTKHNALWYVRKWGRIIDNPSDDTKIRELSYMIIVSILELHGDYSLIAVTIEMYRDGRMTPEFFA